MANQKKLKKIFLALLLTLLLPLASLIPAGAAFNNLLKDVPGLSGLSEVILLQSLDDGSVIFSQNEYKRTAPASLTKIITAILVLENCPDLSEILEVQTHHISMFYGRNSSNAGLKIGEQLSIEDLLYCMLIPSANEAAVVLADRAGGGIEPFVGMMNEFAQGLGCVDTQFMNPHGLDEEGHYTTAADIALITRYALSSDFAGNAVFEKIISNLTYELPATNKNDKKTLLNTNRMLNKYYPDYYLADITGVKTGTTDAAGDCIVAKASRSGFSYLCIVMRGQKAVIPPETYLKNTAFVDAKALLQWAFKHIRLRQVTELDKAVAEVPVELARNLTHVQLVPDRKIYAFVPEGVDSGTVLIEPIPEQMPESVRAPVQKGQVIGKASIKYAGSEFAQVDLVAAEDIDRSATMYLVELAKLAIGSPIARLLLIVVILVAGIYLLAVLFQNRKKRKEKQLRVLPNVGSQGGKKKGLK